MVKIKYSHRVISALSASPYEMRKRIIESIEASPEMRKEVRRVFQVANRRIQNLRKHDELFSPSLKSMGNIDEGYSVFGISKYNSWVEIKKAYSRAVAFLQQPTSTVTGAAQYTNALRAKSGLSASQFKVYIDTYNNKLNSIELDRVSNFLMSYNDIRDNFYDDINLVSDALEADSRMLEDKITAEINRTANEAVDKLSFLWDIDGADVTLEF